MVICSSFSYWEFYVVILLYSLLSREQDGRWKTEFGSAECKTFLNTSIKIAHSVENQ